MLVVLALTTAVVWAPAPTAAGPATDLRADETARWLQRELSEVGVPLPGPTPGSVDWGLTADAALALIATGHGQDPATLAVVDAVLGAVDSYTTWDDLGPALTGVRLAGPLAKVTLVAAAASETSHAATSLQDLEVELRGLMQLHGPQRGRFSDRNPHGPDGSNAFGQGLAMLALSLTDEGVPDAAVTHLLEQQCPDGGFRLFVLGPPGCGSASESDTDTTALALQALWAVERTPEVTTSISRGLGWLLERQRADGAIGGSGPTAAVNANSAGLAAQALRTVGRTDAANRSADWISTHLRLGGDLTAGSPAVGDVGAIAYEPAARADALSGGIEPTARDQWRRATTQGVLAFGAVSLGADAEAGPVQPTEPPDVEPTTPPAPDPPPTPTTDAGRTPPAPPSPMRPAPASADALTHAGASPVDGIADVDTSVLGAATSAGATKSGSLAATGSRSGELVGLALVLVGSGILATRLRPPMKVVRR